MNKKIIRTNYFTWIMVLLSVIALVIIIPNVVILIGRYNDFTIEQEKLKEENKQKTLDLERNQNLIQYVGTDEFYRQYIKQKFGYYSPNEIVFEVDE